MPTPIVVQTRFSYRDSQGRTAVLKPWLTLGDETTVVAQVATLKGLLVAMTSAQVYSEFDVPRTISPRPTSTQYVSAQDKAEMVFQDDQAAFHRLQLPAPLVSLFFADQITINGANAAVNAFVTHMLAVGCAPNGNQYQIFLGGIYIRKKLPRRSNIIVLSPDDTSPEE